MEIQEIKAKYAMDSAKSVAMNKAIHAANAKRKEEGKPALSKSNKKISRGLRANALLLNTLSLNASEQKTVRDSAKKETKKPSSEKERQLKEIEKFRTFQNFRTFLAIINAAYKRLPSKPEDKRLKDVKLDVEDIIRRITNIVNYVDHV